MSAASHGGSDARSRIAAAKEVTFRGANWPHERCLIPTDVFRDESRKWVTLEIWKAFVATYIETERMWKNGNIRFVVRRRNAPK